MVDGYFGADGAPGRAARPARRLGRCGAATSWRGCGWRSSTTARSTLGGLVVGTGNKTESLIGYTTLFGDNACAFNPIGDLYKSQVRQLAGRDRRARGRSSARRRRADLWPARPTRARAASATRCSTGSCTGGSTGGARTDELVAMGFDRGARRAGRAAGRDVRVQAPGAAGREARAADRRASTTCTRGGARAPPAPDGDGRRRRGSRAGASAGRRDAVRRRHADRQPRRRHAPGARGRCAPCR